MMSGYVTVDLGATSGRVVVGRLERGQLEVAEVHRFPNEPSGSGRELHWDVKELFAQTLIGLQRAGAQLDGAVSSIGVTAWGVDVGLVDNDSKLLAPIQHYRAAGPEAAQPLLSRLGAQELFARTGVLPQQINTVFRIRQIVDSAGTAAKSEGIRALLMPDLWCALLTGVRTAERSIASTTGLVSLRTLTWDMGLLDAVGVDASLFPPIMDNGVVVAGLRKSLRRGSAPVINGRLCALHHMTLLRRWRRFQVVPGPPSCPRAHGRWWASSWPLQSSQAKRWLLASRTRQD
jgi:rhamnulokinase